MVGVEKIDIRRVPNGAIIGVKVAPGSSRQRIVGVLGDCLKIAVSAPAEGGKANAAAAGLLADTIGIPRRNVTIVSGRASRRKQFLVAGMSAEALRQVISDSPPG